MIAIGPQWEPDPPIITPEWLARQNATCVMPSAEILTNIAGSDHIRKLESELSSARQTILFLQDALQAKMSALEIRDGDVVVVQVPKDTSSEALSHIGNTATGMVRSLRVRAKVALIAEPIAISVQEGGDGELIAYNVNRDGFVPATALVEKPEDPRSKALSAALSLSTIPDAYGR